MKGRGIIRQPPCPIQIKPAGLLYIARHTASPCRIKQITTPLQAQNPIGWQSVWQVKRAGGEGGQLVHHTIGAQALHHGKNGLAVQRIPLHHTGPQRAECVLPSLALRHASDITPLLTQQLD